MKLPITNCITPFTRLCFALFAAFAVSFSGCTSSSSGLLASLDISPSAAKTVVALQPAVDGIIDQLGSGGKITGGNLLATGLQAATAEVGANIDNPDLQKILTDAVTAYSGDPGLKNWAADLVTLAAKDAPNAETLVRNLINTGVAASNSANAEN